MSFFRTDAGLCIYHLFVWSNLNFLDIIIIIILFESFSHQRWLMVLHLGMSNSKSPQVSRILPSILADLNNAVVWMVCTRPLISKSSSLCINPLVTVPSVPVTIGITVTFMFHNFSVLNRGLGTYLFFLSVLPSGQPKRQSPQISRFPPLFLFLFFFDYH